MRSGLEAIMAGGDGRVGGEDDFAGNLAGGGVEVEAFFVHARADGFKDGEAAVAFVEMQDAGRDAHGLERAEAADAEQQFLTNAGARSRRRRGARWCRDPQARCRVRWSREGSRSQRPTLTCQTLARMAAPRVAISMTTGSPFDADGGLHGELIDVGLEILFALPAVLVEALQEVSLAVEEADADERDVEIGCALDVIAGEDAEAAGVDGQRLVQAELGREVGDGARTQHAGVGCAPGAVCVQILLLAAVDVVDAAVQDEFGWRGARFRRAAFR